MTNKSYQDRYTRYHDEETLDGSIASNNGWIYTAYGRYLAPDSSSNEKLLECYNKCYRSASPLKIDRSPNDLHPPLSKDEIVGMVSLGFLNDVELEGSYWNFCNLEYEPQKLNIAAIWQALKAFKRIDKAVKEQKLTGSDARNYMWQKEETKGYSLGFWLQPWDQYYVKKMYDKRPSIFQTLCFYINFISVLTKGNKSVRMMLWLQLTDMNHFLLRYVPKNKWVRNYFEPQHPFVKGLK